MKNPNIEITTDLDPEEAFEMGLTKTYFGYFKPTPASPWENPIDGDDLEETKRALVEWAYERDFADSVSKLRIVPVYQKIETDDFSPDFCK